MITVALVKVADGIYQIHAVKHNKGRNTHLGGADLKSATLPQAKAEQRSIAKQLRSEFPKEKVSIEGPFALSDYSEFSHKADHQSNPMRVVIDDLWLCQDCMICAVNGELPPDSSKARDAKIVAGLERLGPHLVPDFDTESGDGEEEFSASRCDCCRTHLAGDRYRFAVLGQE